MPIKVKTDCTICAGDSFTKIYGAVPAFTQGKYNRSHYSVLACDSCGVAITTPVLTEEELADHYVNFGPHSKKFLEDSVLQRMNDLGKGDLRSAVLAAIYRSRGSNLPSFRKPVGSLLDIGAGSGEFCVRLKQMGWETHAHDVFDGACGLAEKYGVPRTIGRIADLPALIPARFDVVTAWQVLEHVTDPRSFASVCMKMLRPGGKLIVEVPHFDAYERHLIGEGWWSLMCPIHTHHYNKNSIRYLFREAGFRQVTVRAYGSHFKQSVPKLPRLISSTIHKVVGGFQSLLGMGSVLRLEACS